MTTRQRKPANAEGNLGVSLSPMKTTKPNPANPKVIAFKRQELRERFELLQIIRDAERIARGEAAKPIRAKRAHHVQPYNGAVLAFVA